MVTPYPPISDGIASYAVQSVRRLRDLGHTVEVLSPGPSAAHHHIDLRGPRGGLALSRRVVDYDRVVVQFHPDFYFEHPSTGWSRTATALGLTAAFVRAREVEVRVHEVDYTWGRSAGPAAMAVRSMWKAADRVVVHSASEKASFVEAFGVRPESVLVVEHGADFLPRCTMSRDQARLSLGISPEDFVFLSIGFIQPHKGFDRAVRAFAALGLGQDLGRVRLDLVGSVRVDAGHYLQYVDDLRESVDATPEVRLHLGYVSDEKFDRWIVASDVVLLPYREIWSSGVLERARLYPVRVIATDVGALADQVLGDDRLTVVENDDYALAQAMASVLGRARPEPAMGKWDVDPDDPASVQRAIEERALLARGGPIPPRAAGAGAALLPASEPLRILEPLGRAAPVSARPGAGLAKRVVARATDWQMQPLVGQVNALREACIRAIDRVAAGQEANLDPTRSDRDQQPTDTLAGGSPPSSAR